MTTAFLSLPVTLPRSYAGKAQLFPPACAVFAEEEGCTFFNGQIRELSYLHSRDVTYATFCEGPYAESIAYRDFMGWDVPRYLVTETC